MMIGEVRLFSGSYGFISPMGGGEDHIVHFSHILWQGRKELSAGEVVLFESVSCDGKKKALRVISVNRLHPEIFHDLLRGLFAKECQNKKNNPPSSQLNEINNMSRQQCMMSEDYRIFEKWIGRLRDVLEYPEPISIAAEHVSDMLYDTVAEAITKCEQIITANIASEE